MLASILHSPVEHLRSQNLDNLPNSVQVDVAPTITPGAKVWLFRRQRMLTPLEKAGCQCLVDYRFLRGRKPEELSDLAGNAFNAVQSIIAVIRQLSAGML